MNSRIKQIRKEAGMTQQEFASKIGLSRNYIAMIEMGQREPSDRTISDICREFGVARLWLEKGEGSPKESCPANHQLLDIVSTLMAESGDDFKKRFVVALLQCPPEWWGATEDFIKRIAEAEKEPRGD